MLYPLQKEWILTFFDNSLTEFNTVTAIQARCYTFWVAIFILQY